MTNSVDLPKLEAFDYKDAAIRGALMAIEPAYLIGSGGIGEAWGNGIVGKAVVILSAPTLFVCGAGALEGTVRVVVHVSISLFSKIRGKNQNKNYHIARAIVELKTTQGLIRGALFPPSGYAIMHNESRKFSRLSENETHPKVRVLMQEYFVYQGAFVVTKQTALVGKEAVKLGWKVVSKSCSLTYDILDKCGVWSVLGWTAKKASSLIAAGVGKAFELLPQK